MDNTLYLQVVIIARDYLGPAAQRFVDRQIIYHLKKEPENLCHEDLSKLASWVEISITVLTDDAALVEEFGQRINALTEEDYA